MNEKQVKLRRIQLEILDVFHCVCQGNHLRYSLAYGTLLGAVRHSGFIPWDDDIDVLMPREDYNRLLAIWDSAAPENFILQTPLSAQDITNTFAKIRKDHTTFIQTEMEKGSSYHKGIFIDIFPLDRLAPAGISRAWQTSLCLLAILYNRGHTSVSGRIVRLCEHILLTIIPRKYHRRIELWAVQHATRWNRYSALEWFGFQTVSDMKHHYSPDLFSRLSSLPFEGKQYSVFHDYEAVLRDEFGDYMQLPPVEERVWKHHPIVIDFEHNYEELNR